MDQPIAVNHPIVTETGTPKRQEGILVDAARRGDPTAFEELVGRNKRLVLAITRRITGSVADAEDLCQQAFMKAFANISRFRGGCSFSTWLVSIAVNEARMWRRKVRRSREVSMNDLSNGEMVTMPPPEFLDWRPNPEATCLQRESSRLLLSAMDHLRPGMRDALQVCDLGERSTVAAAILLEISTAALKSRRLRGRLALRQALESTLSPRNRRAPRNAHNEAARPANQRRAPRVGGAYKVESYSVLDGRGKLDLPSTESQSGAFDSEIWTTCDVPDRSMQSDIETAGNRTEAWQ